MKKSETFLFYSFSFIIGIAVGLLADISFFTIYILLLLVIIFVVTFWNNKNLRIFFIGILFLFLGIGRTIIFFNLSFTQNEISKYNETEVAIKGMIIDEPQRAYSKQKFKFKAKSIKKDNIGWAEIKGNVLVYVDFYPSRVYGDNLEIKCKLATVEPFDGFRYDKYLAIDDIYSICYYPEVKFLGKGNGNIVYAKILVFKDKMQNIIKAYIDEPQASILSAVLLGNKYGVNKELKDLFSRVGISHIIAVSGMHIAIVSIIILFFLSFIGISRKKSFYITTVILVLYVIMIGAPASAVRAVIMAFVILLAVQIGRLSKLINAILLAAVIMIFVNPYILFYDVGFQFSFIALLGIFHLFSIIRGLIKLPLNKYVKDLISISLSAEIAILPLVFYYFGLFSLTAPFTNLLVVWLIPSVMLMGIILVFTGMFPLFSILSYFVGALIGAILKYIIFIAGSFASPQWVAINVDNFPLWGVGLYYIFLAFLVLKSKKAVSKVERS
ncbi:ComEC/Rec2 family competence protein [Patescibacteria group bacterium]